MAREPAPVAWDDEADDELIVSRESLVDVTPHATSRAAETPQPIGWQRNLSLRQRIVRGSLMTLLVSVTLLAVLGGPAATLGALRSAGAALNARLHPARPQPTLADEGYKAIRPPPGGYNVPEMSIAPIMGASDAAWACWAAPVATPSKPTAWTARAFLTTSGGVHWTSLTLPTTSAQTCTAIADGESAHSALIILGQGAAPDGSCMAPYLYFTTDTGASWSHVSWPDGPSDSTCSFTAALRGAAIYLWATTPLVRGVNPYQPPTGRLIVSRDAGGAWALADVGLDDTVGMAIVGFRPGGHILATVADVRASGSASTLMASDDYGASWRNLGDPPGAFPQVFVSSDNSVINHGGWGRLYSVSQTLTNGVPSVPRRHTLATAYLGQPWTAIPLPPLPNGATASAQANQPFILGVGPADALEVERGVVEAPNAQLTPAQRLWVWNPTRRVWLLDPQAIPGNVQMQGVSWHAGDQVAWLTTLQLGVPPILQIYTKVYPSSLFGRNQKTAAIQR